MASGLDVHIYFAKWGKPVMDLAVLEIFLRWKP